jgi:hypothetical protein
MLLILVVVSASMLAASFSLYSEEPSVGKSAKGTRVLLPSRHPQPTQASIDYALMLFDIHIPENVKHPVYDPELADRGLTVQKGIGHPFEVRLGPTAFTSWAILGSTLSHEIEVHCRQEFALIRLLDLMGMNGTLYAERVAYQYEISQAKRFKLSRSEQFSIADTVEFYYPLKESKRAKWDEMKHAVMRQIVAPEPRTNFPYRAELY